MSGLPANPTESFKRRNPQLYPTKVSIVNVSADGKAAILAEEIQYLPKPTKPRIRQSQKPLMNKLEREWLAYKQAREPDRQFDPQCVRFKLGNGIWYKPDFICWHWRGGPACWEIKGPHAFRGGFENLKVAASRYPKIDWYLVWKENGQWQQQLILA